MHQPTNAIIFSDGNTAVFGSDGQQMPELQESWMRLLLNFWESKEIDPTKIQILTIVNGRDCHIHPFKTSEGDWTWRID